MRKLVRFALRSVWLCAELLLINADFAWLSLRHGGAPRLRARTQWLQRSCRRVLRVLAAVAPETVMFCQSWVAEPRWRYLFTG